MELAQVTISSLDEMPQWRVYEHPEMHVPVIQDVKTGKILLAVSEPRLLTLIMALPGLLRFAASFKQGHPCFLDVQRILSVAHIKLGKEDSKNGPRESVDD